MKTKKYRADWESLNSRPTPEWFDKAKLGIYVFWGIYAVPAYAPKRKDVEKPGDAYSEWYGCQVKLKNPLYYDFHKRVYGENFEYEDFVTQFKGEMFDADKWADLFARSGAKYVTVVTKHHDAFTMWPSRYSWKWNSADLGLHRDVVGELFAACDKKGLTRGAYFSLMEWSHPDTASLLWDGADYPRLAREKLIPQMKELIETYKPKILFSDGDWIASSDEWLSKNFLAWLFNESSVKDDIVINDRWGSDCKWKNGGYYTSEYADMDETGEKHKWEEQRSVGASFGFNRNEDCEDYLTERGLIECFADIVARGGNLLLNVGPCADGTISPIIQERLIQLGDWLRVNGEAIYESKPTKIAKQSGIWTTGRGGNLYVMCAKYPKAPLTIECDRNINNCEISLLGSVAKVNGKCKGKTAIIEAPYLTVDELPCNCVYTFKISARK